MKTSKITLLSATLSTILLLASSSALAADKVPVLASYVVLTGDSNSNTTFNTGGTDEKNAYLTQISSDTCAMSHATSIAVYTRSEEVQKAILGIRLAMKAIDQKLDFDVAISYTYSQLPNNGYSFLCNWSLVQKGTRTPLKDFESVQAGVNFSDSLSTTAPDNCKLFSSQSDKLTAALNALQAQINKLLGPLKSKQGLLNDFDQFSQIQTPTGLHSGVTAIADRKSGSLGLEK